MPHIIVSYSTGLDQTFIEGAFLLSIREAVLSSNLFEPAAVKARALAYKSFALHEGFESFLHIEIALLSGREEQQLQALGQHVFKVAQGLLGAEVRLSVEVREMNKATYFK